MPDPMNPAIINPGVVPAPTDQKYPGQLTQELGGGGEGVGPNKDMAWWEQVKFNALESIGGMPGYGGSLIRAGEQLYDAEADYRAGKKRLTPDELKQLHPGYEHLFTDGSLYPSVAADRVRHEQRKQQILGFMSRGEGLSGWNQFTSGLAATAMSPLDLAVGIAAGKGVGALADAAGVVATGIRGVGSVFAQNVAGNVAVQGLNVAIKQSINEEVDLGAEANAAFSNAALFTGIHYAFSGLARMIGKYPKALREEALRKAIGDAEQGLQPDVEGTTKALALRESGANQQGANVSRYKIIEHPLLDQKPFYLTHSPDTLQVLPDEFGGYFLTDHLGFAKNLSESPEGGRSGRLFEGKVPPGRKALDLEQTLHDPEALAFARDVEKLVGRDLNLDPEMSLKEVIRAVRDVAKSPEEAAILAHQTQNLARSKGYGAYQYSYEHPAASTYQESLPGQREMPYTSTALSLFDLNDFRTGQQIPTAPDEVPRSQPEEAQAPALIEPSPPVKTQIQEAQERIPLTPEAESTEMKTQEAAVRAYLEQPEAAPEIKKAVNDADREYSREGKVRKALKGLANCFLGGL